MNPPNPKTEHNEHEVEESGSSSAAISSPDKKRSKLSTSSSPIPIVRQGQSTSAVESAPVIPFWVAGASPIKFVSFDELVKMNDSIEKMNIVHKIATEPGCTVEDLKPKDPLHEAVKTNIHKAYWDLLRADLNKDPPKNEHAFLLLRDLKEMILDHLRNANLNNALSAVEETLDLDHLHSLLDKGILNFESVLKAVLSILEQLCAPIRDELVARLKQEGDLVELFREIFTLVENMQMDMANFTLARNRQLIGTYSARIEFEEFTKLMDVDKNAAENTKRWLAKVLSEYHPAGPELSRSDVNELIVQFYLALLTTNPSERRIPFPETIKLDEPKIEALGEKYLQLELTAATIFIASNLVGKSVCEGTQFKADLKRDLLAILNDIDWKNYTEKLENVLVQCAQKCKESVGNEGWTEERAELLKQQITGLSRTDDPIRVIARNRICDFVDQALKRTGEPLRVPPGFSILQTELASLTSRFYAISVHNWNAFGRFYGQLLDKLMEEAKSSLPLPFMINSIFIVNTSHDVILEKHYKSVIHRSICDYFFDVQKQSAHREDIPPVIATPHHYLYIVYHNGLYFIAVSVTETPPLMVIEVLHRIITIFADYFTECSDSAIKENIVIVFELLDEILDNGYPLCTELNVLQDMIKPPNFLRSLKNQVTGRTNISDVLPTGQLSNVPWRRAGVKYTNNEAYFDVIEEIDAIIDKQGATISAEIHGYIDCCCKLSGMPDLTMTLTNPRILDDVSFHPCVRFRRWENERLLSFVPPDGNFRLLSYHISFQSVVAIPLYVRHNIQLKSGAAGRLELTVGPKQSMGKMLEEVVLECQMPRVVQNCNLVVSHGKYSFDPTSKLLQWTVGKIDLGRPPTLKGTVSLTPGIKDQLESPPVTARFKINQLAVSGVKVNRLDMHGESYKPFKGVKYITKAGKFQVRTT